MLRRWCEMWICGACVYNVHFDFHSIYAVRRRKFLRNEFDEKIERENNIYYDIMYCSIYSPRDWQKWAKMSRNSMCTSLSILCHLKLANLIIVEYDFIAHFPSNVLKCLRKNVHHKSLRRWLFYYIFFVILLSISFIF